MQTLRVPWELLDRVSGWNKGRRATQISPEGILLLEIIGGQGRKDVGRNSGPDDSI